LVLGLCYGLCNLLVLDIKPECLTRCRLKERRCRFAQITDHDLLTQITVAANLAKSIGALADSTSGSSVYGGLHTWMCGPAFSRDDKAVQV